ncbi:MAG: septum formation inhibitor Maf [Clostridia bacterium]|nr:septum formation inhibitor Maf [Clostridia bacterium]
MKIILASKSPRRKEILETMGVDFVIDVADADESVGSELSPVEAVCEISKRKADAVFKRHECEDCIIISADTVVVIDGKIIGKPKDENDAFSIIKSLSGRTHEVYTGFTVCGNGKAKTDFEVTKVHFKELCDDDIRRYVATGEPMDKAGAYGIQQKGNLFVEYIHGDYYNVVGFPISKICVTILELFGINILY